MRILLSSISVYRRGEVFCDDRKGWGPRRLTRSIFSLLLKAQTVVLYPPPFLLAVPRSNIPVVAINLNIGQYFRFLPAFLPDFDTTQASQV